MLWVLPVKTALQVPKFNIIEITTQFLILPFRDGKTVMRTLAKHLQSSEVRVRIDHTNAGGQI